MALCNSSLLCSLIFPVFWLTVSSNNASDRTSCQIPGGRIGQCVPSERCATYTEAINARPLQHVDFLRHVQCSYNETTAYVCCPGTGNYTFLDIPHAIRKKIRQPYNATISLESRFGDNMLPSDKECGKQNYPDRIFNGIVTGIDEFPWLALMVYKKKYADGRPMLACGGVLISKRYVLTAAHCVTGKNYDALQGLDKVRLGEYNTEADEDCITEVDYEDCAEPLVERVPEEIIVHPEYNADDKHQHHDIALIRLDAEVKYSDFIKPICLPDEQSANYKLEAGSVVCVAGWGKTEAAKYSPVKLKLGVPIVKEDDCIIAYKKFGLTLGKSQICAGGERGKDSCKGDSGGPLMVSDETTGNWITSGVVSIGPNNCGQTGIPGIYTKVQDYVDWIKNSLKR